MKTIFNANHQLYKVLVKIKLAYPDRFRYFSPRLVLILLMSSIGCIGSLMCNSGLEEILKKSFAGVEKIEHCRRLLRSYNEKSNIF